jgi:hypothetical protein
MNTQTCSVCGAGKDYLVVRGTTNVSVVCSNCSNATQTLANAQSIATPTAIGVGKNATIPPFSTLGVVLNAPNGNF